MPLRPLAPVFPSGQRSCGSRRPGSEQLPLAGGVHELLRHRAGLHPHGCLRGPGEPAGLSACCPEEPLAVGQLQGDGGWPPRSQHSLTCPPSPALGTEAGLPTPEAAVTPLGRPPSPPQGRAERPLPWRGPHCSRDPSRAGVLCIFLPCCGFASTCSELSLILLNFNASYEIKLKYKKRRGTRECRARGPWRAGMPLRRLRQVPGGGVERAGPGFTGSFQAIAMDPTTTE